jgi:hypothetical protein
MFRIKRTRWISLGLVLAVLLLLPLPASAGGFWESAARGWEGAWTNLFDWIGSVAVEMSCAMTDPNGCPGHSTAPGTPVTESCMMVDPNGCPGQSTASGLAGNS